MFALQGNPEAPISIFVISCTSRTSTLPSWFTSQLLFFCVQATVERTTRSIVRQTAHCGTRPESCVGSRMRVLRPGCLGGVRWISAYSIPLSRAVHLFHYTTRTQAQQLA